MNPVPGDVHINRPLTNILIAYTQGPQDFVATRVFPNIPVGKQSDMYFTYSRADWTRSEITRPRGASAETEGSGWRIDPNNTYFAEVFGLHKDIDDRLRVNADPPVDLDRDATLYLGEQALRKKEKDFVTNFFTTSKWTGADGTNGGGNGQDLTGTAAGAGANEFKKWSDPTSDPIENVTNQIVAVAKKTGKRPNKLVLSANTWIKGWKNHPDVLDRIKYTQKGVATPELVASLLDIDEVLIAWGIENTAAEGAAESMSFILPDAALLVYAAPNASILQPSGGYTFSWTGYLAAGNLGERIKRFRVEHLNSDRIEIEIAYALKLIGSDLGVFFTAAV